MNGREYLHELFNVRDKVIVVTGTGSGIGNELARALARLGATVVGADLMTTGYVEADLAAFEQFDLRNQDSIVRLHNNVIDRFGHVDVLVNNAGIAEFANADRMDLQTWNKTIDTNLTGTFLCSQVFGRSMLREGSGSIVNIASRCGEVGLPFTVAYNASKAGIVAMTKTLATEWGDRGVRVNAIVPGFVRTPHNASTLSDERALALVTQKVPLGRISEPSDLVGSVVYLSSSASLYVTGAVLVAYGGALSSGGLGAELRDHWFQSHANLS